MEIAFLLFDGTTHLDSVGPYEVLHNLPDADVKFVAKSRGTFRDRCGMLGLTADYTLDQVTQPDILVVPGGGGADAAAEDTEITDWVARAHETTGWTTSVCHRRADPRRRRCAEGFEGNDPLARHGCATRRSRCRAGGGPRHPGGAR